MMMMRIIIIAIFIYSGRDQVEGRQTTDWTGRTNREADADCFNLYRQQRDLLLLAFGMMMMMMTTFDVRSMWI
jgi:hypothetical protein